MDEYETISKNSIIKWMNGYELKNNEKYTQVSAYIFNELGELLIVKNEKENNYTIPGGHPEEGETKEETLKREVMEEAYCTLKDIQYLGALKVIEDDKEYYQLRYVCHIDELKEFKGEMEISERLFVKVEDLDKYILWANGIMFKRQIEDAIKAIN